MKTTEEIISYFARRIGTMYYHPRPLMYGGTAEGVDLHLRVYHEIYAEIVDRQNDFMQCEFTIGEQEKCGSNTTFSMRYKLDHPAATEEESAAYAVQQWRKVSNLLGVPINHQQMQSEFDDFPNNIQATSIPNERD